MSLHDLNAEAVALISKIAHYGELQQQAQTQLSARIQQIADLVKKGESVGDPIKDFVIVAHHTIDNRFFEWYKKLKEHVQACCCQYVLLVQGREEERFSIHHLHEQKGLLPPSSPNVWKYTLGLSVLKRSGLLLDPRVETSKMFMFDVDQYATCAEDRWLKHTGPLSLASVSPIVDSLSLVAESAILTPGTKVFSCAVMGFTFNVLIGNFAIKEWLNSIEDKYAVQYRLKRLCTLLGENFVF